LTARTDRASRLRLALKSLLGEHQRQLDEMLPLRQLVKGSVYLLQTRCGKPTCHCASAQGPLHSSTVLSWSEHAKTRLRTLPSGERARFRQLTENYRRFRRPAPPSSSSSGACWPPSTGWKRHSGCHLPSRPRAGASHDRPCRLPVRPPLRCGRLSTSFQKSAHVFWR